MCIYPITLPALLNFPPTLPPQAGILKAGGVGIEFSLKAKHALEVLVNAETAQKSAPWLGSVCECVSVCESVCLINSGERVNSGSPLSL